MSSVQVADQTFVAATGEHVSATIARQDRWRRWWPDLRLTVTEDRAEKGVRWAVAGALDGTMEIWLEPSLDGVVLHYFLHAEPRGGTGGVDLQGANRVRRVAGKRMAFDVKRELEAGRAPGEPPLPPTQ